MLEGTGSRNNHAFCLRFFFEKLGKEGPAKLAKL
jgi:hypothetical protein